MLLESLKEFTFIVSITQFECHNETILENLWAEVYNVLQFLVCGPLDASLGMGEGVSISYCIEN